MADYRSMYDSNYLYSWDLKGRDVAVTIKDVKVAKVSNKEKKDQRKPILFFKESHDARGLVLCKTNGKTIAAMYGTETNDWIGKRITLFSTQVDAFGQTVDAIRIRPKPPTTAAKPGEFAEPSLVAGPEAPEHAEVDEP